MKRNAIASLLSLTLLCSCGGGSSGGGADASGAWGVRADISSDTCGERIANVRQPFNITSDGSQVIVDTSIVNLTGSDSGSGFTASFSESNGDCNRTYTATFSSMTQTSADVHLTAEATCGSFACASEWHGTATQGDTAFSALAQAPDTKLRINGERCIAPISDVGYRPSLFECNGNAAVLLRGSQRAAFSVVLRRDGAMNDRDPENPSCGTNRCSPYKVQKKIELPEYQVNCLGDNGFSDKIRMANRISIKYQGMVTDSSDPRQFEQYCLADTTKSLN